MNKTVLVCSLIVYCGTLVTAIAILSEVISGRKMSYRKIETGMSVVFATYSTLGFATIAYYYVHVGWQVIMLGFYIWASYFIVSVIVAYYKIRKDEIDRWKKKYEEICMSMQDEKEKEEHNSNVINLEEAKKHKKDDK